jgi:hypothetical protein
MRRLAKAQCIPKGKFAVAPRARQRLHLIKAACEPHRHLRDPASAAPERAATDPLRLRRDLR